MDAREFRRLLEKKMQENREAFEGQYGEQLNGLLGLSKDEIDAVTPDNTDLLVYEQLITIVREASRVNVAQAQLKENIEHLGDVAIQIAKRVRSLAPLFV